MSCAKTAEPIEMTFGVWTGVGPGKHALDRRSTLNHPCVAAIQHFCQITVYFDHLSNSEKL